MTPQPEWIEEPPCILLEAGSTAADIPPGTPVGTLIIVKGVIS